MVNPPTQVTLSLVVPCFNEEAVLFETAKRLCLKMESLVSRQVISENSKIVFVDDGSKDTTWELITQYHSNNPKLFYGIKLSKNCGHQNALLCGLLAVENICDAAISIDADLQDDIEVIDNMVEQYKNGAEIVYGVRSVRKTDTLFKRITAHGFYSLMNMLGANIIYDHADYRLMGKKALKCLAGYREVNLFLRGIVPLLGFKTAIVTYARFERFAGESKYPLRKMLRFAFDGITSFSIKPIRIYWLSQKEGFMVDEGLSITLACYNEYMWTSNYPQNVELKGNYIKEISLCDNDSFKSVIVDIARLYKDNRDTPHTNFYYSLLRISLAGLKTGDIKPIIIRGGILNLVLFSISFFVFLLFIRMLFGKNKIIPYIAVFCAFISPGTISNTIFLRDYQLQETLFILFSYVFFKYIINTPKGYISEKRLFIDIRIFSIIAVITSLTLLTGYYAIFFIGLFGIYAIYYNKTKNNNAEIIIYFLLFIFSVIIAQFLFPRYITGFGSNHATNTSQTLFGKGIIENVIQSVIAIFTRLLNSFFTLPVIIITILILFYLLIRKNKIQFPTNGLVMLIIAVLFTLIVMILAPWKELRYIMPILPFLVILPLIIINSIKNNKIALPFAIVLCFCFTSNSFNIKNIDHVYKDKPLEFAFFTNQYEIPVVVINENNWKYADLIPYINDNQTYIFCDKEDYTITLNKYNDCYFIVEKTLIDLEDMDVSALNESMEKINEIGYFAFYRKK